MRLELDEPELAPTPKRGPAGPDPDKTPVPDVSSLSPEVRRELSSAPPARRTPEKGEPPEEELRSFFSRPSVPPPPPSTNTVPPPVRSGPPKQRPQASRPKPARPAAARAPEAKRPVAAPPAKTAASMDEDRMKKVYRTYVAARKRCNEPTDRLSFDKVASSLRKQYEAKGGSVDFKVVIRGGKAVIKTVKS